MEKLIDLVTSEMQRAFGQAGYEESLGKVTLSNRPDLCEFQCNGAMAGAKQYKKAPMVIAGEVAEFLQDNEVFFEVVAVPPGFLNCKIQETYLVDYLSKMEQANQYGVAQVENPKKIMIDYGGPNVAKPLHVGHLRSAIIGESVKRIARYIGHTVVGDIHLGDWGLQMGLIVTELQERQPNLVYFQEDYQGEYPQEAPFTIAQLEEIYPTASARSKEDLDYKERAMNATFLLQSGQRGYRALWNHILQVSVADLKKNYNKLQVSFDLWKGESDVQDLIPAMVEKMKQEGHAYLSEGALVVDVARPEDTKEVPPCMILKSDGASLYNTTDLATIVERMDTMKPDQFIYVVDKRQELYFEQVFRCARKTQLVTEQTQLDFLGFGTMNGKDGKPFKTREGGVMRLEQLLSDIHEQMFRKILDNRDDLSEEEAHTIAQMIALSAIKYGDLSNQAGKDYIFDTERFTSFEGDTGPYILYTIVRIKSILRRYVEQGGIIEAGRIQIPSSNAQKMLMLELAKFNGVVEMACAEQAPHRICAYIYDLANACNKFYHETKILVEEEEETKAGYIGMLQMTRGILEEAISLLGFEAPEKM
ncbi:MAG: arginine--tRNA ligase [Eubacteriales bacterium]